MNSDDEQIPTVALKCSQHTLACLNYIQLKGLTRGRGVKMKEKWRYVDNY